jgi:hypothetical protein
VKIRTRDVDGLWRILIVSFMITAEFGVRATLPSLSKYLATV